MFLIVAVILLLIPLGGLNSDIIEDDAPAKETPVTSVSPWQQNDTKNDSQDDIPAINIPKPGENATEKNSKDDKPLDVSRSRTDAAKRMEKQYFKILDESTGKVVTISQRDYIRGAVCSEMPATFQLEALKAQAVSAHTYALNLQKAHQDKPDPSLKGADFSADPSNWLVYVTEDLARERFGDSFLPYWDKICSAADSVSDQIIVSDGEPIAAAYHAISSGTTESAKNVWGNPVDYLVPAESPGDLLAPKYEEVETFSVDEMKQALSIFSDVNLDGDVSGWLSIEDRSDSGYVTKMKAGGTEISGLDFRGALRLRSSDFKLEYQKENFKITTSGYGHGVGLSQYGADFMARQGSDWKEIIKHYYNGVEIKSLS